MTIKSISQILRTLQARLTGERVDVAEIFNELHERGFGLIILLLALPMALPVPVPPGVNIILASPLVLLTAQQALGRRNVWLPRAMQNRSIARKSVDRFLNKAIPLLQKFEPLVKPRLPFMTQGLLSHCVGGAGLIMALAICIPLPLTNTIPSIGIAMMAIGVLSRDGLIVLCGALIGLTWVIILALAIIFLGNDGIDFIKHIIKEGWVS